MERALIARAFERYCERVTLRDLTHNAARCYRIT